MLYLPIIRSLDSGTKGKAIRFEERIPLRVPGAAFPIVGCEKNPIGPETRYGPMRKLLPVSCLTLCLLIAPGCGENTQEPGIGTGSSSSTVGPEGDVLSVTTEDGITVTLTIPPDAIACSVWVAISR